MNVLSLFQSKSKTFYLSLVLLSVVCSVTNMGILFVINMAETTNYKSFFGHYNYLVFMLLVVTSFLCTAYFEGNMASLTNKIVFDLEISIIQKIINSSYESFEKVGKELVYSALGDTGILGRVPEILILIVNSSITIICALVYLFWVSPSCSLAIFSLIILLLFVYLYRNKNIMKELNEARDYQNKYYSYVNELIQGFKQIRISSKRNIVLFDNYILKNRRISKDLSIKSTKKYIYNELSGSYIFLILLGIIVFVLPVIFKLSFSSITIFITTILFIRGPVSSLVNSIPLLSRVKISINRFDELDKLLKLSGPPVPGSYVPIPSFESIRFENIKFNFRDENDASFNLELVDFKISNNEIVFIVGGNGSGKTTLINLFTGLYKPLCGRVYIDNVEVNWDEFTQYSNNMAVIYSDHYLFKENYDEHDLSENNSVIKNFKEFLNVDNAIKKEDDLYFLNSKLSKGQQKRVFLLLALMEEKPIIILDEWAAEQDQKNRDIFYTRWLQEIKKQGKTIILVSHDDDCYSNADRIVKLSFGKIASDTRVVSAI